MPGARLKSNLDASQNHFYQRMTQMCPYVWKLGISRLRTNTPVYVFSPSTLLSSIAERCGFWEYTFFMILIGLGNSSEDAQSALVIWTILFQAV